MIVTYTITLRGGNGEATITVPNIGTKDDEVLLKHIKDKCAEHYNSQQFEPNDYLDDPDSLLILLIH